MDESKRKQCSKRTKAEREEWVAEWQASGKPVRVFAAEQGLASSSLYQWVRRLKTGGEKHDKKNRKPAAQSAFTEVSIVGRPAAAPPAMTIALRGGHSVTFEGVPVDAAWLASVLKVMSAC